LPLKKPDSTRSKSLDGKELLIKASLALLDGLPECGERVEVPALHANLRAFLLAVLAALFASLNEMFGAIANGAKVKRR
jgi:hypothetical protein